jgi:hypothetical protein
MCSSTGISFNPSINVEIFFTLKDLGIGMIENKVLIKNVTAL